MTIRSRAARAALLAVLAAAAFAGCARESTIAELMDDPARFDGKKVRLVGDVEDTIGAFGMGTYRLNDGTGRVQVLSDKNAAPRLGARVGVEGTFHSAFTMGATSLGVVKESRRFTP